MTPELARKANALASRRGVSFSDACSELGRRGAAVKNKTGYPSPAVRLFLPTQPSSLTVGTIAPATPKQLSLFDLSISPYESHHQKSSRR